MGGCSVITSPESGIALSSSFSLSLNLSWIPSLTLDGYATDTNRENKVPLQNHGWKSLLPSSNMAGRLFLLRKYVWQTSHFQVTFCITSLGLHHISLLTVLSWNMNWCNCSLDVFQIHWSFGSLSQWVKLSCLVFGHGSLFQVPGTLVPGEQLESYPSWTYRRCFSHHHCYLSSEMA